MGLELGIVALLVYYIRLVGYNRIRIAFGGVSLCLGGFTAFVAYLLGTNSLVLQGVAPTVSALAFYGLIFMSVVQILAGILNLSASER